MKPRIKFSGVNDPKDARELAQMIEEAKKKKPKGEKDAFFEAAEREEAKFLVEGFDRV